MGRRAPGPGSALTGRAPPSLGTTGAMGAATPPRSPEPAAARAEGGGGGAGEGPGRGAPPSPGRSGWVGGSGAGRGRRWGHRTEGASEAGGPGKGRAAAAGARLGPPFPASGLPAPGRARPGPAQGFGSHPPGTGSAGSLPSHSGSGIPPSSPPGLGLQAGCVGAPLSLPSGPLIPQPGLVGSPHRDTRSPFPTASTAVLPKIKSKSPPPPHTHRLPCIRGAPAP